MQYKVLKIEEDMDFGCEERQPGEALMSVVLMEDENGNYNFINFKWNGTPMSKEDYQQQVKKLIDLDKAVFIDGENNAAVSVSEIISQIENY